MRGKRPQSASYVIPGPGAYNPTFHGKKQWERVKIGNARRDVDERTFAPGPGAYTPSMKNKFKTPTFIK